MAHSFASVYLHIIFLTKLRASLLTPEIRERLFPYMGGIIRELKGIPVLINGMEDHVHLLTTLPTTISISDLLKEVKAISSGWVNDQSLLPEKFGWQNGYAAFSVSSSIREKVRKYIEAQQEHHRRMSFQEEYLAFLERHGIQYDPRFVFDMEIVG